MGLLMQFFSKKEKHQPESQPEKRLCVDCKHFHPKRPGFEECNAPQNLVENLVTGTTVPHFIYCEVHRGSSNDMPNLIKRCGSEGHWFEPKQESGNESI